MTGRLSLRDKKYLEKSIKSGPKQFKLLYSFTNNGADATTFHQLCDNKGPTVTVVYNTEGTTFGGYTGLSWTSDKSYSADTNAFLFQLQFNKTEARSRFPVKRPGDAIYGQSNYGPTFGGHDFYSFNGKLTSQNNVYTLNGSYSFGTSYDMSGTSTDQLTNNIKTVIDLEVYSIADSLLGEIWRDTELDGWELKDLEFLKNGLSEYSPPQGLGLKSANILLVGPVGAGKSSFFNTVSSVFRGHISTQAASGNMEQSVTSKYRMYNFEGSAHSKPLLNFRLCDTRGLEENHGIEVTEFNHLLDGNIPNGYPFNPFFPISLETPGFISNPTISNKIHCVCFIIDGSTTTVMPEKMLEKIKVLQSRVCLKGIPQVVVVTKVDKVCSLVDEDLKTVFQSNTIKELVDTVSDTFGVPRNQVLPMKNYEKEINLKTDVSILALLSLKLIIRATEDYLFDQLDFIKDTNKNLETVE